MNRIIEIDEANLIAAELHVITGDLRTPSKVGVHRRPASLGQSVIGGNVAERGARGLQPDHRSTSWGRAVLPTGEIVDTGGAVVKNAGLRPDAPAQRVGSTLAIITRSSAPAPKPLLQATLRATF
jgi:FAD/FMN-containing dehydrogenase